jgi:hypothetical protein
LAKKAKVRAERQRDHDRRPTTDHVHIILYLISPSSLKERTARTRTSTGTSKVAQQSKQKDSNHLLPLTFDFVKKNAERGRQ